MEAQDVVSSDLEIVSGAVVFKGTRVPVSAFFDNLMGDMSIDRFLDDFPTVERFQAEEVLKLACQMIERSVLFGKGAQDE